MRSGGGSSKQVPELMFAPAVQPANADPGLGVTSSVITALLSDVVIRPAPPEPHVLVTVCVDAGDPVPPHPVSASTVPMFGVTFPLPLPANIRCPVASRHDVRPDERAPVADRRRARGLDRSSRVGERAREVQPAVAGLGLACPTASAVRASRPTMTPFDSEPSAARSSAAAAATCSRGGGGARDGSGTRRPPPVVRIVGPGRGEERGRAVVRRRVERIGLRRCWRRR